MNKLQQISTFIMVVQENGFAAAARKLGISTAAVSRQLNNLEASLGVQLLQRTTRQIRLTEIGCEYLQHCKKTLAELAKAEEVITGSQEEATGVLHITSSRYFAVRWILPRLAEFMALNPKLKVQFELAERFPDFAQEKIDLLFGVSVEGPAELVRKQVAITRYVLCAAPAYLEKYGTPKTPADLMRHRYITHSVRKPANVINLKDNQEVYVEPVLWLNDNIAMRECAIAGMGIVSLHDYIVAEVLKEKKLVQILVEYQELPQPVFLYYQQSRFLQPKIRRFIDFYTT